MSVPGYPFARERYWVDTTASKRKSKPAATVSILPTAETGSVLAHPKWMPMVSAVPSSRSAQYERHEIVLCNLPHIDPEKLKALAPGTTVLRWPVVDTQGSAERYRTAAMACFEHVQAVLKSRPKGAVLLQIVIGSEKEDVLLAGLAGLIRSARLENSQLFGQIVLTTAAVDEALLARQLSASQGNAAEVLLKYAGDTQSVLRWQIEEKQACDFVAYRNRGVYLITGGLGGLGLLFARDILKRVQGARIVFTGRSDLTADKRQALERLAAQAEVARDQLVYRPLDLKQLSEVEALVAAVVKESGGLNGVIHSAGMTRDALIINKTTQELSDVMDPKVAGTVHLDLATRNIDLDFLVYFSSISSVMGNGGQADYAVANSFMDQFAAYRNELVSANLRRGRTLSINWPLWEEGGMQIDPKARVLLAKASGIHPMRTQTGLRAFHRSLELPASQTLIVEGELERLRQLVLQGRPQPSRPRAPVVTVNHAADKLRELVLADLRSFQARRN